MWIVRLALRSPYIFVAMALLIAVLEVTPIRQTGTGTFPEIGMEVQTDVHHDRLPRSRTQGVVHTTILGRRGPPSSYQARSVVQSSAT